MTTADTMRLTCISHLSLKSPSHTHTPNTKKHLESITGFSIPEIVPKLWRRGTGSKDPFPRKELSPREALAVCTPPAPKPSARTPGS